MHVPGPVRCGALLALLCGAGCSVGTAFQCGEDSECLADGILGVCQANDYCSFPDPACDSEQRYGSLAPEGLSEECVPPGPDVVNTSGAGATSGATVGASGAGVTTALSDSASGGDEGPATSTMPDDESQSGGTDTTPDSGASMSMSGAMSDSDDDDEGDDPFGCAFQDLGPQTGDVDHRNFSQHEDDFQPSCGGASGRDIAYRWEVPLEGTYDIVADGGTDLTDTLVVVYSSCGGMELACNDDGAGFSGHVKRAFADGEVVLIVVDAPPSEQDAFTLRITLDPRASAPGPRLGG